MDEHHYKPMDVWDNGVYGTGKMNMPKENSGIVALLMIAVIFLSGLVSVLSFMNIRLFQQLQQEQLEQAPQPIAFAEQSSIAQEDYDMRAYSDGEAVYISGWGVWMYAVTEFDQNYFHWPEGLLIVQAEQNPYGLREGDILISADGNPVTNPKVLNALLRGRREVEFTFQRGEDTYVLCHIPGKAE